MDLANSLIVLLAVALAIRDAVKAHKDQGVRGVGFGSALLLVTWPIWDLAYYSSLSQNLSLIAALLLAVTRAAWVYLGWVKPRSRSLRRGPGPGVIP